MGPKALKESEVWVATNASFSFFLFFGILPVLPGTLNVSEHVLQGQTLPCKITLQCDFSVCSPPWQVCHRARWESTQLLHQEWKKGFKRVRLIGSFITKFVFGAQLVLASQLIIVYFMGMNNFIQKYHCTIISQFSFCTLTSLFLLLFFYYSAFSQPLSLKGEEEQDSGPL